MRSLHAPIGRVDTVLSFHVYLLQLLNYTLKMVNAVFAGV